MSEKNYTIGFSNIDERNPFAVSVRENLERAAAQHPTVRLISRDNAKNTERAMLHAREFSQLPVNLAIIFHVDERAGLSLTTPLKVKRIPIISVDIPIPTTTFFGINNAQVGHTAGDVLGRWIQAHWGNRIDKVLIMTELRLLDVVQQRMNTALQALTSLVEFDGSVLRVDTSGERALTVERTAMVLNNWRSYRRIAIICLNDEVADGVLEAVYTQHRERDVAVLSYDGTPIALNEFRKPNSPLVVSPSLRPKAYGEGLLNLALRMLKGESVPHWNYVETVTLTRDNFEQALTSG